MNIGECVKPKKPVLWPRPVPKLFDVDGPRPGPDCAHIARHPNTSYNKQLQIYNLRKADLDKNIQLEASKGIQEEIITKKYITHSELKSFQRALKEKVNRKIGEYDANLEVRRQKLGEVMAKEEREFNREVVIQAQKGKELKIQEEIARVKEAKRQDEEAREALAKEKRTQQYLMRCTEFRPILANQRLQETKRVQLIQMQENEAKKQSEKELDEFWYQMTLKYSEAQNERNEQDRLKILQQINEYKHFTHLQAKQKIAEQQAKQREKEADRERLDQLRKEIEEEERIAAEKKILKKQQMLRDFKEQMGEQETRKKRVAEAEKKIQTEYDKFAEKEIEKEKIKSITTGYKDMINYQNYLAELKQYKEAEEAILEESIQREKEKMEQKENEVRCNAMKKIQAMQEDVLKGRVIQLEEKRKRQEELQKEKEIESEIMITSLEQCEKLSEENKRLKKLRAKKFADNLKDQMEYNRILQKREEDKIQNMLDATKMENEMYDNIVSQMFSGTIKVSEVHPFTQVVKNEKCPCPKPNY